MIIEKQMQDSVLNYIKNTILNYKGNEDDWVLWNGAIIKIVEATWSKDSKRMLYPDFSIQGTVSEAKYAIENKSLLDFLLAKY